MADTYKFPKTGVFVIGTGADGANNLRAVLSIDTTTSSVIGRGDYSKVQNPVLTAHSNLKGAVHATGLGTTQQIYALQGTTESGLLGASNITSLVIVTTGIWGTEGVASYTIYNDTPTPVHVEKQPVKVTWLLTE
jgi:hypothetical protein